MVRRRIAKKEVWAKEQALKLHQDQQRTIRQEEKKKVNRGEKAEQKNTKGGKYQKWMYLFCEKSEAENASLATFTEY